MIVTETTSPVDLISTNVLEDYNEWLLANEPYSAEDRVVVSDNPASDYPQVWESTIDNNTAGYPPDCVGGEWVLKGYSNPYLMFDRKRGPGTSTENADLIDVTLGSGLCDTLALIGTVCNEAEITVTDNTTEAVVMSEVVNMRDDEVYDYYDYFFVDYSYKPSLYRFFPKFYDSKIRVQLRYDGQTAVCGICMVGPQKEIGMSEFGTYVDLNDWSKNIEDDLGRIDLSPGRYSMKVEVDVEFEARFLDRVVSAVAAVRGKPSIWQINNVDPNTGNLCTDHRVLLLYGYCRKFRTLIPGPVYYKATMEIMELG